MLGIHVFQVAIYSFICCLPALSVCHEGPGVAQSKQIPVVVAQVAQHH